MKTLIILVKNFWLYTRTAFRDSVDLIMFSIALILSVIDLTGTHLPGAVGFLTAYIFFALNRIGYYKLVTADKLK